MDFAPSAEQLALQEGIRAFCDDRVGVDRLHEIAAAGGFDAALWKEVAELGVFQLRVAESDGGLGLGASEAALVFEELGRRLVPGPLVFTELSRDWVDGGSAVVAGLDLACANPEPLLVEHRDSIDALLVLRSEGAYWIDAAEIVAEPVVTALDPLTPVHVAERLPEGRRVGDAAVAARLRREGRALVSAQLLGIAEATLTIALDHAKTREQFGRPIGSFQAIKHMLADMFARQELARASVYAAAALLDHPEAGDPEAAACGAKLLASEAALENALTCIQIHGGMGYTWEMADHYYLKRCRVLENTLGSAGEQALELAAWLAASVAGMPGATEVADVP